MELTKKKLVITLSVLAVVLCVLLVVAICLPGGSGKDPQGGNLNLREDTTTGNTEETTVPDVTVEDEGEGNLYEEEGATGPSFGVDGEGEDAPVIGPTTNSGEGDPFEGVSGNEGSGEDPTTKPTESSTEQEVTEPSGSTEGTEDTKSTEPSGTTNPSNGEDDFVIDFDDLLKGQQ